MKYFLSRFLPYFKEYKKYFFFAIVGMILAAFGTAGSAYVIKPVLDEIFINKNKELLYLLPYAIVAMYFFKGFGKYIQVYFTSYIGQDIVRQLRDAILKNILNQDMVFFSKYRKGELISRIINDIERVRLVVSTLIPDILRESMTIVALIGVVIYQSPKLAIFGLIILPIAIYPITRIAKRMKKISTKSQESISDVTSILGEIFNNIEMIKANWTAHIEEKKFSIKNLEFFKINMKAVKVSELVSPIMEIVGSVGVVMVIIVGGMEVIEDKLSVGSFFSFTAALFMLYTPIKRISSLYTKMQDALAAGERIFFMLDSKPSIIGGNKEIDLVETIEFKNVSLNYDDVKALQNVSISAKKGEVIAFVGNSGGGKSSLVNLLIRFYEPSKGEIKINNKNISKFSLKSLRNSISIITQRVYILNDTIANNVSYGLEYDEKRVEWALKEANAYEFVSKISDGIKTILSENGANLSGGQRQRIAIARLFYKDPKIIILDEATSALDNASEQEITLSLEKLKKNRITFVIAHRLSTIKDATKIVVLQNGEKICEGDEKYLLANCKEYQKLKGEFIINE